MSSCIQTAPKPIKLISNKIQNENIRQKQQKFLKNMNVKPQQRVNSLFMLIKNR